MGFIILAFMKVTLEKEEKVANFFASIYQLYLNSWKKMVFKEELNQIIEWFTGFYYTNTH